MAVACYALHQGCLPFEVPLYGMTNEAKMHVVYKYDHYKMRGKLSCMSCANNISMLSSGCFAATAALHTSNCAILA